MKTDRLKKKRGSVLFFIFFSLVLVNGLAVIADTGKSDYYNRGKTFLSEGRMDDAIESFKKVLYVNRNHSRSSFALADIYETQKKFKKAEKEYRYCLKIIPHDKTLTAGERETLFQLSENKITELKLVRKIEKALYIGRLNSVEINFLLFAATICLFLLIKGILIIRRFIRHKIIAYREGKIWIDRYWERQKGREIRTFASYLCRFIVYFFLFFIIFYAGRIIMIYGFNECCESIHKAFIGLFM